jgi:hypothetical protein
MHPVVFELYNVRLLDFWTPSQLENDYATFKYW